MMAMRFWAHNETIAAFLQKYDSIPVGDRGRVPWEAVALAAKLDPLTLQGAIMQAIIQSSGNLSKILAISSHPKIMRATIKYAKLPSGEKDRRAADIMVGALPSPKGPTFIGKAVFGGGKDADDEEQMAILGKDADMDDIFPSAPTMQEKLNSIRQRQLPD